MAAGRFKTIAILIYVSLVLIFENPLPTKAVEFAFAFYRLKQHNGIDASLVFCKYFHSKCSQFRMACSGS
jgi:hypothetical protein